MGYGSADYSSGYSAGKSAGRSAERARISDIERKSVAQVLSENPHFQEGVKAAQTRLGRECGYIGSYVDQSKITIETPGFLHTGLFASHADPAQTAQIIAKAQKIIHDNLLSETLKPSDDDYSVSALAVINDSESENARFELGHAAQFVTSLTERDYFNFGYTGRIAHIAETLANVHSDGDWTKWLLGDEQESAADAIAQPDKNYRKYLIDALQDIAAPVQEKVKTLLNSAPPPYAQATGPAGPGAQPA